MNDRELASEILTTLGGRGLREAEVFLKSGRSRRFEVGSHGRVAGSSHEKGWAVRAGDTRASLFVGGTGVPRADTSWPEPDGQPLHLPAAMPIPPWRPPPDLDASLMGEIEAIALLEGLERALLRELPGARLLRGILDEGTSQTSILNSRGVEVDYRSRAAGLFVEAVGPWQGSPAASLLLAEREIRRFQPTPIAKRLANRLLLAHAGSAEARERGEILIGSAVACRMLAGLLPLLTGAEGQHLARRYRDRRGRIASSLLTVIDDGRYPGGVLEAPVDGEGCPTGAVVLIEEGRYRQALMRWHDLERARRSTVGCTRRDSWRDQPRLAPSHLYIAPRSELAVGSLVSSVSRGCYLVEPMAGGRFELNEDYFELPVCGFELRQGKATAPLCGASLEGSIRSFLQGIQAVSRDLAFQPLAGMIGSPSLLVSGLGLRRLR